MKPADAQGHYEIKCLPADGQYMVVASAKGYGRARSRLKTIRKQTGWNWRRFVLKLADQVIAGQVLDDDDKPVSGVNVNLTAKASRTAT